MCSRRLAAKGVHFGTYSLHRPGIWLQSSLVEKFVTHSWRRRRITCRGRTGSPRLPGPFARTWCSTNPGFRKPIPQSGCGSYATRHRRSKTRTCSSSSPPFKSPSSLSDLSPPHVKTMKGPQTTPNTRNQKELQHPNSSPRKGLASVFVVF